MPASRKIFVQFPTTSWTLLEQLRNGDLQAQEKALEDLCRQYQRPLYGLIRHTGLSHHDAEDALQEFFSKVLRLEVFQQAAEEKGRLRTFLRTSLSRFLINRHHAGRRHLEVSLADMNAPMILDPRLEQHYQQNITQWDASPDVMYDRQWCQNLLQTVLKRLEEQYVSSGKEDLFQTLSPVLQSGGSLRAHDTAAIAQKLNMKEAAVRVSLLRLLRHYRRHLEDEVRHTVSDASQVRAEIRYLQKLVSS